MWSDLAPLRQPAFQRYLLASSVAFVSLWIYITAMSWTLLELSDSAAILGLFLMATTLPLPFVSLPAGALTDRIGPRDLMVAAFAVEAAILAVSAGLAVAGLLSVPVIIALALAFGMADGMIIVTSQVIVGRLVEPEHMGAAIGHGWLALGVGRVIGAPVGGALVAMTGAAPALALAAGGIAVASVILRRLPVVPGTGGGSRLTRADIKEGFAWLQRTPTARPVLILTALAAVVVWPYLGLLAVVTRDLLGGDPAAYGLLAAAGGIGTVLAALPAGGIARRVGAGRLFVAASVLTGVAVAALGTVSWLPTAIVAALLLHAFLVTVMAMSSLVLQSMAAIDLRGRAISIQSLLTFGLMPVGMLGAGVAADALGVDRVLFLMGLIMLVGSAAVVVIDLRTDVFGNLLRRAALPEATGASVPVVAPLVDPIGIESAPLAPAAGSAHGPEQAVGAMPTTEADATFGATTAMLAPTAEAAGIAASGAVSESRAMPDAPAHPATHVERDRS